jgi:hypothetical protein
VFVESFWANDIIEDSIELIKSTVVVIFILIAANFFYALVYARCEKVHQ